MFDLLEIAARAALPNHSFDQRNFWVGAAGLRGRDNVVVLSKNGACVPNAHAAQFKAIPEAHAEARICRKLGKFGVLAVVRIRRLDGRWAMARPCGNCETFIRSARVQRVYYSINEEYFGIWDVDADKDRVCLIR